MSMAISVFVNLHIDSIKHGCCPHCVYGGCRTALVFLPWTDWESRFKSEQHNMNNQQPHTVMRSSMMMGNGPIIEELTDDGPVTIHPEPYWDPSSVSTSLQLLTTPEEITKVAEIQETRTRQADSFITRISKSQSKSFIRLGMLLGQTFKDAGQIFQDSLREQQEIVNDSAIKLNIRIPDPVMRQLNKTNKSVVLARNATDGVIDSVAELLALVGTEVVMRSQRVSNLTRKIPVVREAHDLATAYLRNYAAFYGMLYHVGISAIDTVEETTLQTIQSTIQGVSTMFGDDVGALASDTTMLMINAYLMTSNVRSVVETKRIVKALVNTTIEKSASNVGDKAINTAIANMVNNMLGKPETDSDSINNLIKNIAELIAGTSMTTGEPLPGVDQSAPLLGLIDEELD